MMAKYLGIPLTVSNGNKTPLTAQSELVDNGNFEDGTTDWLTTDATIAVVDGQLEVTSTASFGKSEQSVTTVPGKAYVVSAKVTAGTVPGRLELFSTPNILSSGSVGETVDSGYKIVSRSFVATSTTTTIQLKCQSATLGTALFDNVTLKEIAATETPTYGSPQLIPNSDFTSGSGWDFSAGSGASISNDELTFASSPNLAFASTDTIVLEKFKRYVVKIDITSLTGDNPRIRVVAGGDSATYSPYYSVTGVYTHTFTAIDSNTNGKIQVYFYSDTTGGATVNSVTLYEVPFVMGTREFVKNGSFITDSDWVKTNATINGNKATLSVVSGALAQILQSTSFVSGKTYKLSAKIKGLSGSSGQQIRFQDNPNDNGGLGVSASNGLVTLNESLQNINIVWVANSNSAYIVVARNTISGTWSFEVEDISIKELEYNYLQVSDGGFKKSVKEGDVVFNTSTGTEGVVKEVIDNNVLLMSNNNFSTADEFFNVFAANGDTRGNQIVRIDNYIMSEYDEDPSNPQESSFWYAGGVDADKVTLTHLVPATNTFFVADLIESYTERLNNQSATASRLDIPLDAFRDHQHNEVLTTTSITLS